MFKHALTSLYSLARARMIIISIAILFLSGILFLHVKRSSSIVSEPISNPAKDVSVLEPITIGYIGNLTGKDSIPALDALRGIELAKTDLGAKHITVVTENIEPCDRDTALRALTKLDTVDRVSIVIVGVCDNVLAPAAVYAEKNNILLLITTSHTEDITKIGDYIFRVSPHIGTAGIFVSHLISDDGYKKIAIVSDDTTAGMLRANAVHESFSNSNQTVVLTAKINSRQKDFSALIDKLVASDAEAVFFASDDTVSGVSFFDALKKREDYVIGQYAPSAFYDESLLTSGALEDVVVFVPFSVGDEFKTRYKKEYEEMPTEYAVYGYDAFEVVERSVRAGALDGGKMKRYLPKLEFNGFSGHISFNDLGDVVDNYTVYFVQNGAFSKLK